MLSLQMRLIICLTLLSGRFQFSDADGWTYEDEEEWAKAFPICGSETQSPIDFNPETAVYKNNIPEFNFHGYESISDLTVFNLTNTGHSVQMNIGSTNGIPFWISGGGLTLNFTLAQFHFHWGNESDEGSEHTIQDAAYPMELHLVHYDSSTYSSFNDASNKTNGLAVLGVFVQIGGNTNSSTFDSLIKYFSEIKNKDGVASNVNKFPLNQLLPNNTKEFYRYRGSLTTPPCYNSVTWTVFKHPITISELQLREFQTRLFEDNANDSKKTPLVDNFRKTQKLNGREVSKTFEKVEWSYNGDYGVDNWKYLYPECNGESQSPIDISTESVTRIDSISPLVFTNYQSIPSGVTLTLINTGTSLDLVIGGNKALKISGAELSGDYVLDRVTFHWGQNNGLGSEHRVNNFAYPLEVQFVHYSSKYDGSASASLHEDGLAIFSVFFQAGPVNNSVLEPVWSQLESVVSSGKNVSVKPFALSSWIPTNSGSFYRYTGSITVPNCAEAVIWTIFTDPVSVSARQLDALRTAISAPQGSFLVNNFRPVQSLHDRKVKLVVSSPTTSTTPRNGVATLSCTKPLSGIFLLFVVYITNCRLF